MVVTYKIFADRNSKCHKYRMITLYMDKGPDEHFSDGYIEVDPYTRMLVHYKLDPSVNQTWYNLDNVRMIEMENQFEWEID